MTEDNAEAAPGLEVLDSRMVSHLQCVAYPEVGTRTEYQFSLVRPLCMNVNLFGFSQPHGYVLMLAQSDGGIEYMEVDFSTVAKITAWHDWIH